MTRMVDATRFLIPNGQSVSNELSSHLRDAYQFVVTPPAVLPEVNVALQFFDGVNWVHYDASSFLAGIDNYKVFDARGLSYRLRRRDGTNVTGDRTFEVIKRVAGDG